jgi:hypothetical protein
MIEICPKCEGTGKYKHFGECNQCRGTGKQAFYANGTVTFEGKVYKPTDQLNFINNGGNWCPCELIEFQHKKYGEPLENESYIPLSDIWYRLKNLKTGKENIYPLWKSILLNPEQEK